MESETMVALSYTSPRPSSIRLEGQRRQLIKEQLYQVISGEVHEEFHPPPPPMDYNSTTKADYERGTVKSQ